MTVHNFLLNEKWTCVPLNMENKVDILVNDNFLWSLTHAHMEYAVSSQKSNLDSFLNIGLYPLHIENMNPSGWFLCFYPFIMKTTHLRMLLFRFVASVFSHI